MKKIIIKTALITLGISLVLAVAVFGIVSFCFPYVMMDFTASLGMTNLSGDYAYQEYERSGSIDCLARSFVIAAERGSDRTAQERFSILYGEDESEAREKFEAYCASYKVDSSNAGNVEVSIRSYILGLACRVKFRQAKPGNWEDVCAFAISVTEKSFPQGNPVIYLAIEAIGNKNSAFCATLLTQLSGAGFEENKDYLSIVGLLEETQQA